MRAVRFRTVGDPSVLGVDEVPEPRAPRGTEILVRVEASSVNGTDLGLRRGDMLIATVGRMPFGRFPVVVANYLARLISLRCNHSRGRSLTCGFASGCGY